MNGDDKRQTISRQTKPHKSHRCEKIALEWQMNGDDDAEQEVGNEATYISQECEDCPGAANERQCRCNELRQVWSHTAL
jgi:hypothetical protein